MIEVVTEREIERKDVLEAFRTIKHFCINQKACPGCPVMKECHSFMCETTCPGDWEVPDE